MKLPRMCIMASILVLPIMSAKAQQQAATKSKTKTKTKLKKVKKQLPKIPCKDLFWELYRQPNLLGKNDCSNKCARYYHALKKAGFKAKIVILKPWNSRMKHAVVRVEDEHGVRHFDPVRGIRNFKAEDVGRVLSVIEEKDFKLYAGQFK